MIRRRSRRRGPAPSAAWLLAISAVASAADAVAVEPVVKGEPRVMREPGEVVDVIDAFDGDDPLDVRIGLAFELGIEGSTLMRENGAGATTPVASESSVISRLRPKLEVGVFRDVSVTLELPLALSRTRALTPIAGATSGGLGLGDETLAALPFQDPERSGLERLTIGVSGGVLNQARDRSVPTWVFGAELRFDVSTPMHACDASPKEGQVACADPGDRDRDGRRDAGEPELATEIDPGIGRGTLEIGWRTAISRRIRYFEPYGILEGSFEVPLSKSALTDALSASETASLPVRGVVSLGVSFVPWENRERFSRISLDARVHGGFVTRGLEVGALFDAIGSSDAASLRSPTASADGDFYDAGVTVEDAHGALGARGAFAWRASELIAIGVAVGLEHALAHRITGADSCVDGSTCEVPDPIHEELLDAPGARFTLEDAYRVQVSAHGSIAF